MLIEVVVKGLTLDPVTSNPIIILKDRGSDRVLPIWINAFEAGAISMQLENLTPPRPMTHDLLRQVIADLGGRVDRVVVNDLRDSTFFAVLYLTVHGEVVAVDARPSDAIALALRAAAPILVDERVLDSARDTDLSSDRADTDRLQRWLESLDSDDLGKYKM